MREHAPGDHPDAYDDRWRWRARIGTTKLGTFETEAQAKRTCLDHAREAGAPRTMLKWTSALHGTSHAIASDGRTSYTIERIPTEAA